MKRVEELRKEAERARRLLGGVADPRSTTLLTEYADACDAKADQMAKGEPGEASDPEDA